MKNVKPYGNNILIRPIEKQQVLVADRKTMCEYGEVVSIGESVKNVKVGDIIGYTVWGINHLDVGEERYYFIPEDDRFILCKFEHE